MVIELTSIVNEWKESRLSELIEDVSHIIRQEQKCRSVPTMFAATIIVSVLMVHGYIPRDKHQQNMDQLIDLVNEILHSTAGKS